MSHAETKTREPKAAKVAEVTRLREKIQASPLVILTDYRGLQVSQMTTLRHQLFKMGAEYTVVKKTLFRRALGDLVNQLPEASLQGPLAVLFAAKGDEVGPAKTIIKFVKDNEKPAIQGGILENAFAAPADIKALAKLPAKEILLAQVVATFNAPIQGFVNVLAGTLRQFVTVIKAIHDKKEKGGE